MGKKFYEFNQNNSGGSFHTDDKLCHRVIIEANDTDEAIDIAEDMGIYFNGCDSGMDCECCGDRWSTPWDSCEFPKIYGAFSLTEATSISDKYNGKTEPATKKSYGVRDTNVIFENVEDYAQYLADDYGWTTPDVRIFYLDGNVKEIFSNK